MALDIGYGSISTLTRADSFEFLAPASSSSPVQEPALTKARASSNTLDQVHRPHSPGSPSGDLANDSNVSLTALSMRSLTEDFPFLRADHSFDASSLANDSADRDPSSICISFAEGDVVYAHWVHDSGWGDVTLLASGRRGWIPINYFSPLTDSKSIPLLAAAGSFISNPRSQPSAQAGPAMRQSESSFSQAAINEIVAGVRSLLDLSGTLNRDSAVAQKSQTVRRHRKALLTELAYLVSVAKQNKKSTDDAIIDKLVRSTYRIIDKAISLLDVWSTEQGISSSSSDSSLSSDSSEKMSPKTVTDKTKLKKHRSMLLHHSVPATESRIDEVSVALCEYLNVFVHRMSSIGSDPAASVQILTNTRHCMLACRELLVVVEAISGATLPRNAQLEALKDAMFTNIRQLVSAARQLVSSLSESPEKIEASTQRLSVVARECSRIACECTAWCHTVLDTDDVNLPFRDYPEFKRADPAHGPSVKAAQAYAKVSTPPSPRTEPNNDGTYSNWSTPQQGDENLLDTPEPETENNDATNTNRVSVVSSNTSRSTADSQSSAEVEAVLDHEDESGEDQADATHDDSISPSQSVSTLSSRLQNTSLSSLADQESDISSQDFLRRPSGLKLDILSARIPYNDGRLSPTTPMEAAPHNEAEMKLAALHPQLLIRAERVRAGTLPALIAWLTDPLSDNFNRAAFLLTFRLFTTSKRVGEQLVARFGRADAQQRRLVLDFVSLWLESYWRPIDQEAFESLDTLTVLSDEDRMVSTIIQRKSAAPTAQLVKRSVDPVTSRNNSAASPGGLSGANSRRSSVTSRANPLSRRVSHEDIRLAANAWGSAFRFGGSGNGNDAGTKLLDYDPADIASALFAMDAEVLTKMQVDELLDQRFSAGKRSLGQAPNVVQLIHSSNHLSAFVGDTVLSAENLSPKTRRNIIRLWIRVAEKCYDLGNFNSLVTIVSALQSSTIVRLRKIWDLMSPKTMAVMDRLSPLASPERHFAEYRQELRSRGPNSACMPYIGLFLSELTLIDEGNPQTRHFNGVQAINFDRFRRSVEVIANLQTYQEALRRELPSGNPTLRAMLRGEMEKSHAALARDSDGQWRRSCVIEPRS